MSQGQINELRGEVIDLRTQVRALLQREASRGKHRQVRVVKTIAGDSSSSAASMMLEIVALDCSSPGDEASSSSSSSSSSASALISVYPIVFMDVDAPAAVGRQPLTALPRQPEDDSPFLAHALDPLTTVLPETILSVFRHNKKDRWWIDRPPNQGGGLVGVQLAEQHPGRGILFTVYLGAWDASLHKWIYDQTTTYRAIDWRYGVPYPAEYATGLAEWRPG